MPEDNGYDSPGCSTIAGGTGTAEKHSSYSRIVKSTSLVGGSEVVTLLIGIVQTKFVAIFLGPLGVGLSGTYSSLIGMVATLANLGIRSSGVKEVAAAVGSGDQLRIGRTVLTLRRVCWLTGTAGALAVTLLARPLSQITFGSDEHAWAVAVLGWTILLRNVASAQMAYIQGLRRIGDLVRLKIASAIVGATIGIGFYAWLGITGVVPALVSLALADSALAWWFARKAPAPQVDMTWQESIKTSGDLARLGVALMWAGLLGSVVAYLTRLLITRELSLEAVGIFQSSFRISGLFVNFILGAMASDFYPRLTAVAVDHERANRLVNEQTEIGLLLAVPGLVAMLAFAPTVIRVLYTAEFAQSAELLKWFVLGCLGRVISWPMGFTILAKGKGSLFAGLETFAYALHIVLIWIGLLTFGLLGVSVAFFALYIIYTVVVWITVNHLTGFTWSAEVHKLLTVLVPCVALAFLTVQCLPAIPACAIGSALTGASSTYCCRQLTLRLGPTHKFSRLVQVLPFGHYLLACRSSTIG